MARGHGGIEDPELLGIARRGAVESDVKANRALGGQVDAQGVCELEAVVALAGERLPVEAERVEDVAQQRRLAGAVLAEQEGAAIAEAKRGAGGRCCRACGR